MVEWGRSAFTGLSLVLVAGCGRVGFDRDTDGPMMDATTCVAGNDGDGDSAVDACDNCPHVANDQTDTDFDGVGDACDPRPTMTGDRIALFESFDGAALPAGWMTTGATSWSVSGGDLHVTPGDQNAGVMYSPDSYGAGLLLVTEYTLQAVDMTTGTFTLSLIDAYNPVTRDSEKVGQADPATFDTGHVVGGSTAATNPIAYADAFVVGGNYTMSLLHEAAALSGTCELAGGTGPVNISNAPYSSEVGRIGIRSRLVTVDIHYLVVFTH